MSYPGTVAIDTQNALGRNASATEGAGSGPLMITYQISFTDVPNHVATVVATGEYLNPTGCLFTAQGMTTG